MWVLTCEEEGVVTGGIGSGSTNGVRVGELWAKANFLGRSSAPAPATAPSLSTSRRLSFIRPPHRKEGETPSSTTERRFPAAPCFGSFWNAERRRAPDCPPSTPQLPASWRNPWSASIE